MYELVRYCKISDVFLKIASDSLFDFHVYIILEGKHYSFEDVLLKIDCDPFWYFQTNPWKYQTNDVMTSSFFLKF